MLVPFLIPAVPIRRLDRALLKYREDRTLGYHSRRTTWIVSWARKNRPTKLRPAGLRKSAGGESMWSAKAIY
jgi:hypothetical protein